MKPNSGGEGGEGGGAHQAGGNFVQWAAERPKKSKRRLTLFVVEAPARSVATAVGLIEKLRPWQARRAWRSSSGRKDAHLSRPARRLDTATTHGLILGLMGSRPCLMRLQCSGEGFIVLCSVLKTKWTRYALRGRVLIDCDRFAVGYSPATPAYSFRGVVGRKLH